MIRAIAGLLILVIASFLLRGASAQATKPDILAHDFRSDPTKAGWQLVQFSWVQTPAKGGWVPGSRTRESSDPASAGSRTRESSDPKSHDFGYVSVEDGYWQSPPFGVTPHQYYRLTFQSRAQLPGYWAAMFFAADGQMLPADHNSGIFQTDDWIENELYFQGKADAVSARLWFYPTEPAHSGSRSRETSDGTPDARSLTTSATPRGIGIRNVTLARATDQQVLDWADRLYATLPPVQYQLPLGRWTLIPRTMQKLRRGEPLRIVILGDSIGNDTGNSPLDKLIQRQYPGSRVTVITSVRGGTGCQYYQQENRIQESVVRYKPDLVMIIAISHGHQSEPIRSAIRQIRAQCAAEILLTAAPIAQDKLIIENYAKDHKITIEEAAAVRTAFLEAVEKLAVEECVEFLHLRRLWNEYLAAQQHDVPWFMRDVTHANVRGAQVVARILEEYFAPKSTR